MKKSFSYLFTIDVPPPKLLRRCMIYAHLGSRVKGLERAFSSCYFIEVLVPNISPGISYDGLHSIYNRSRMFYQNWFHAYSLVCIDAFYLVWVRWWIWLRGYRTNFVIVYNMVRLHRACYCIACWQMHYKPLSLQAIRHPFMSHLLAFDY